MLHAHKPYRLLTDERLARIAAAGDDRAFSSLYQRHEAALLSYCRSITREPEDARDALQSAMTAAYSALPDRSDGAGQARAWLFRIAHNESIDILRRRRPHVALVDADLSTVPSAAQETASREEAHEALAEVAELPLRQRGALVLRELHGLDYAEIADALEVSEVNARQLVFAARTGVAESRAGRALPCELVRDVIEAGDRRAQRRRRLRAHLRSCKDCRTYAHGVSGMRPRRAALAVPGGWLAGWASALGNGGAAVGGSAPEFLAPAKGMAVVAIAAAVASATAGHDHEAKAKPATHIARAPAVKAAPARAAANASALAVALSTTPARQAVGSRAMPVATTPAPRSTRSDPQPREHSRANSRDGSGLNTRDPADPNVRERSDANARERWHGSTRDRSDANVGQRSDANARDWAQRESTGDPSYQPERSDSGAADSFAGDGRHSFATRSDRGQSAVEVASVDGGGQLGISGP